MYDATLLRAAIDHYNITHKCKTVWQERYQSDLEKMGQRVLPSKAKGTKRNRDGEEEKKEEKKKEGEEEEEVVPLAHGGGGGGGAPVAGGQDQGVVRQ